jgi:phosphate:Na+ symporter
VSAYALPAIGIGFVLRQFFSNRKFQNFGQILFGFGLLFFGLDLMKDAFKPLSQSQAVIDIFATLSHNPLLGVAIGTIFTMILQSSSATIAIVQTLAFNGVIGLDVALPLILGDNIGTTITAELASIGANSNAERTARAHTLFNVIGTCIMLPFVWLGLYGKLVQAIIPGELSTNNIMVHIAFAHSMFNVLNAIIFSAGLDYLVRLAEKLSFSRDADEQWAPKYLRESLLSEPFVATQQVIKELVRMTELARETTRNAEQCFMSENPKLLATVKDGETRLDEFQNAITSYLIKISEHHLDARESMEYPILLHSVNDLEKIGDYAANIADYADIRMRGKPVFAPSGIEEIQAMFATLYELFEKVLISLRDRDQDQARQAIIIEDRLDEMKAAARDSYIRRLRSDGAQPEAEMMIMDLASNIEKMGDHLISIAKSVIKDLQWGKKPEIRIDAEEGDAPVSVRDQEAEAPPA